MKLIVLFIMTVYVLSCHNLTSKQSCKSALGTYNVEFDINEDSFPVNKLFEISGKIKTNDKSIDLKTLTLTMEAIMPEHHHGMNLKPRIKYEDNGTFKISGLLFHMPGNWVIHFYIKHNYLTEAATYEVKM